MASIGGTLRGIIPPICTPLHDDGSIDTSSLRRLIDHLLEAGVHGIFALGSTGEAIYLDDAARAIVVETIIAHVGGAVPVLVGALDATPNRVIDQMKRLDQDGILAWMVTPPFYANVSAEEIVRHYEIVAGATSRPILAYDIPGNTGRKLPVAVTAEIMSRHVIAGVKDSSGDLGGFRELLERLGQDRRGVVFTGSDSDALVSLKAGADGIVPGLANVIPGAFVELFAAHTEGDIERAEAAQAQITRATTIFGLGQSYGSGLHAWQLGALKHLLRLEGVIAGERLSSPLAAYPEPARARLMEVMGRP